MKLKLVFLISICFSQLVYSQKPVLSLQDLAKDWPALESPIISNNGAWVMYGVRNGHNKPEAMTALHLPTTINMLFFRVATTVYAFRN
jgi:hypothetical protein